MQDAAQRLTHAARVTATPSHIRRGARGVGAPPSVRRPRGVLCVRAGRSDGVPPSSTGEHAEGTATRRAALVGAALMTAALPTRPALAKTVNLTVKDLSTKLCANPQAAGVPGSSTYKASCYEVIGTIVNPSKEIVYNADVYGRVLDSANDPVLRSGRVGAIETVPPGESSFRLEIVVAFSQKPPLKLKDFKAQGFLGVVNRSGNPYDMDYDSGTFAGGNKTNV